MVKQSDSSLIMRARKRLGTSVLELFIAARTKQLPLRNTYETERAARADYERFKDGECPEYLEKYCSEVVSSTEAPYENIRAIRAKRGNVTDINRARSVKKKDVTHE